MTKDDIIRMAREAEVSIRGHYDETGSTPQELERFAALVRADERERAQRENAYVALEREACAKVVEAAQPFGRIAETAAAIRARGQQ